MVCKSVLFWYAELVMRLLFGDSTSNRIRVSNKAEAKTAGKDDPMNNESIVSIGTNSMIYHKPGCRYVERIKNRNKMVLPKHNAKREGYHVCRYCN